MRLFCITNTTKLPWTFIRSWFSSGLRIFIIMNSIIKLADKCNHLIFSFSFSLAPSLSASISLYPSIPPPPFSLSCSSCRFEFQFKRKPIYSNLISVFLFRWFIVIFCTSKMRKTRSVNEYVESWLTWHHGEATTCSLGPAKFWLFHSYLGVQLKLVVLYLRWR